MNHHIIKSLGAVVLLSTGLYAITGKHSTIATSGAGGDNGEICVYCHTPHGANADFGGAPLWNKPTTSTVFKMYGATDTGVAGTTIAGTTTDIQPTDSSMACLSCHDGVSAMNSVVNAPGSGSPRQYIGSNDNSPTPIRGANDPTTAIGGSFSSNGLYPVPTGSHTLADDHPISIQYFENRASLRAKNFQLTDFFGATTINDLLRNGKVQCVSCHDPHGTGNDLYLRSSNANGSKLCMGCHAK